jgi:hypothetical protein
VIHRSTCHNTSSEPGPYSTQSPIMLSVLNAWFITKHFHTLHLLLFEVDLLETITYEMKESDYIFRLLSVKCFEALFKAE